MARYYSITTGEAFIIQEDIRFSIDTSTVAISIYRNSDGAYWNFTSGEFSATPSSSTMSAVETNIGDIITWQKSFAPPTDDSYIVTITCDNPEYSVKHYVTSANAETVTPAVTPEAPTGLNTLEMFNAVLDNKDLDTVIDMSSLTPEQLKVLNDLNRASRYIAIRLKYPINLRVEGTITLVEDQESYDIPNGFMALDTNSFNYDNSRYLSFISAEEWNNIRVNKNAISGVPLYVFLSNGKFEIRDVPNASIAGKTIKYFYYSYPAKLSADTQTARSWLPAPYEETVLVNYATYLSLRRQGEEEANAYYNDVFGDRGFFYDLQQSNWMDKRPIITNDCNIYDSNGVMSQSGDYM